MSSDHYVWSVGGKENKWHFWVYFMSEKNLTLVFLWSVIISKLCSPYDFQILAEILFTTISLWKWDFFKSHILGRYIILSIFKTNEQLSPQTSKCCIYHLQFWLDLGAFEAVLTSYILSLCSIWYSCFLLSVAGPDDTDNFTSVSLMKDIKKLIFVNRVVLFTVSLKCDPITFSRVWQQKEIPFE